MDDAPTLPAPNHHARYPRFTGLGGLVAALSMVPGRQPIARLAVELVDLGPDDGLVDIGCGPGAGARLAAARAASVTGVAPAPVMLRVAKLTPSRHCVTWVRG